MTWGLSAKCAMAIGCIVPALIAQPGQSGALQVPSREDALHLGVEVKKRRYCEGDVEFATMQLQCALRFANTGRQPVILYRSAGPISKLMLAATPDKLRDGKPEFELLFTELGEGWRPPNTDRPDRAFAVLKAGQSLRVDRMVAVPFSISGRRVGAPAPGAYYMQVLVQTWPGNSGQVSELSARWRRWGQLWTQPITSLPIPVKIDERPKLQCCE